MSSIEIHGSKELSAPQPFWDLLRKSECVFEADLKGTSMEPTIPDGARVRIQTVPAESYQQGQVVACVTSGELFAHRIVFCGSRGRSRGFVITLGDNLLLCDPPTRKNDVLGVITAYLAGGAWLSPGPAGPRGRMQALALNAHRAVLRACLEIHYGFARRVGGCSLIMAAFFKRARSALASAKG